MTSLRSVADSIFGKATLTLTEIPEVFIGPQPNSFTAKVFTADVVISEGYSKNITVTEAPVEKDTNLALNAVVSSFSINVNGLTSDTTLSFFDLIDTIAASPFAQAIFQTTTRSQKAYEQLNEWADNGTSLKVNSKYASKGFVDKSGAIIPFLIESLSITRNKRTGAAVAYNFTLRAVKIVTVGSADLTQIGLGVSDKGAQQLGPDNPDVADSPQGERTQKRLVDDTDAANQSRFEGVPILGN